MRWLAWGFALAASAPAHASDTLDIAEPPAWVKVHAVPPVPTQSTTAPSRALLRDAQLRFDEDGALETYWDEAFQITGADGLAKLASVTTSWNPEHDSVTVHRLRILRGGQVIDVLKTQKFSVLHREVNLERASIDGRLTGSLQIEGLQVGDIVEFARTYRHIDPALGGHREADIRFASMTADSRLTASWGEGGSMQWRAMRGLPEPVVKRDGETAVLSITAPYLATPVLPRGAPARFQQADAIQFSDWKDWAQLSAAMAPLYAKAAAVAPDGAVGQAAAKIAASSKDQVARAEAALALVQNQVRYLFVGLNDGGYVPAAAEQTWQRRYGDCKGKTVLLLSLLHALGIEAQPVLVNTTAIGDAVPRYLPAAGLFNHVLVRATIGGRAYWLDGTRMGDRRLAEIETPAFRWGLPLQPSDATLVRMMPDPRKTPLIATRLSFDGSAGFDKPVPAHGEVVFRGDAGTLISRQIAATASDARERSLRTLWRQNYPYLTPTTVSATFDATTNTETLTFAGTAALDMQDGAMELTGVQLGGTVDYSREDGPDQDAPFAVNYPFSSEYLETITLPGKGKGFTLDPLAFDRTIAGYAYTRQGAIDGGVLTLKLSRQAVAPEFPATDAPTAQRDLRRLSQMHLYLRQASAAGGGTKP
ncbi:MAG: DUF3857 domain-containing protein [Sphingomonas sp.]|uniref:DUF3857 domain-containing protein n=1 Tax=Sphingomonas sp. TaxID=28214 RepID=UPI001AC940A1|nr:DUF3857 domain-containing protein [Sphingomonas sp.]MBN8808667.1 DUF3857 domain-containing protein [Sphingomonas sp.]